VSALSAAPTTLTAKTSSASAIALTWTDNSSDETGFEIWRSKTGAGGTYTLRKTVAANATSSNDTGLTAGTQYCYKVRAIGGAGGTPSGFSGSACATTQLSPPTGLVATIKSPGTISLTWQDNSSNETGFEVWRSTTGPSSGYSVRGTVASNATTWADTGLSFTKQYCYRVRAIGGAAIPASALSNISCLTPGQVAAPSSLVAQASSSTTIALTWSDNSSNESGFEIWRSTTGAAGAFSLLKTAAANATSSSDTGLTPRTQYCYQVRAVAVAPAPPSAFSNSSCATTSSALVVRIVLFGDSNTDRCEEILPPNRISSYVSVSPRLAPTDPHLACSVPGKVEAAWKAARPETIRVVNHGISSTTTGGNTGLAGDPVRSSQGTPNARTAVNGVTRFEGEVLGKAYPWSGGEPTNTAFPTGPVLRVNAYTPGPNDFVYVSMGTNDDAGSTRTLTATQTAANLRWMVQQWTAAGRAADHFILTTLAPRTTANSPTSISDRNTLIRALAAELGVHLIDLAAYTSDDNGATWRSPSLNIGDGVHYTEAVRAWLAGQVTSWMSSKAPAVS
jgi:lysophospholipase L1-like esterase